LLFRVLGLAVLREQPRGIARIAQAWRNNFQAATGKVEIITAPRRLECTAGGTFPGVRNPLCPPVKSRDTAGLSRQRKAPPAVVYRMKGGTIASRSGLPIKE
jgi:hypothetical protein